MIDLRFTLLSDGSSDRALLPILTWLLQQHLPGSILSPTWADLRALPDPPAKLDRRIEAALDLFPCDLLFIHRDAEGELPERRLEEIRTAVSESQVDVPFVCVVPVRMMEAWLLTDERGLRRAAGNPNGTEELRIPAVSSLEVVPDPKELLEKLLKLASGLSVRRLKRFRVGEAIQVLARQIADFSALRGLPAFRRMELELEELLKERNWA